MILTTHGVNWASKMKINFIKMIKNGSLAALILLIAACGGGEFEPQYDDNQPQSPNRRINGELPFSSPSLMKMAESYRIAGDYPNAIRVYQRAANESPRHVTSRLALGQIYQRLGSNDGAAVYYQQVLDLEDDNMEAQLGLGQVMVLSNKPLEAVTYLEEVARKSPDNFRIYNSIGLAYDLQGLHGDAQNAYGKGLVIRPNHISLLNNLALSLAIEGEYAPSIQLLGKAVNIDYSQTTAQMNLIMVYGMSGDEKSARTMAKGLLTEEEVEESILHYRWLKSLTSQKRAQAIFLNLTSFPDEVIVKSGPVQVKTQPMKSMDPKRQQLLDILNSEDDNSPAPPSALVAEEGPRVIIGGINESEEFVAFIAPSEMLENENLIDPEEMIPESAMTVAVPADHYRLQLGTYASVNDVIMNLGQLRNRAPILLESAEINAEKFMTADNQEKYRLYVGDYDNINAAEQQCSALNDKNVSCIVEKIEPSDK